MKRLIAIGSVAVAIATLIYLPVRAAEPAAPDEITSLKKQITMLQAENAKLKSELATKQSDLKDMPWHAPANKPSLIKPDPSWQTYTFDGQTVYLVPLAGNSAAAQPAAMPADAHRLAGK